MNKKTMKIAMVAVVAAVAGTVTYQNQTKEVVMSELALANVEALAQNEGGAPQIPCIYEKNSTCYYQVKDALGFVWNAQTDEMKHI